MALLLVSAGLRLAAAQPTERPAAGFDPAIYARFALAGVLRPPPVPAANDFPAKSSSSLRWIPGQAPPSFGQPTYLTVRARGDVPVYESPGGPEVRRFGPTLYSRTPTTFLVTEQRKPGDGTVWYEVLLPTRPNMTRGWVRADHVEPRVVRQAVLISLSRNQLDLYQDGRVVRSFAVCVGADRWPTPTGDFFVNVKLLNPGGAYGPYALGLSAFSDVLTDWPGGGQVGIHGTSAPSSIGRDVSHGCVRLLNKEILTFAPLVELGTPVFIRP